MSSCHVITLMIRTVWRWPGARCPSSPSPAASPPWPPWSDHSCLQRLSPGEEYWGWRRILKVLFCISVFAMLTAYQWNVHRGAHFHGTKMTSRTELNFRTWLTKPLKSDGELKCTNEDHEQTRPQYHKCCICCILQILRTLNCKIIISQAKLY